MPMAAEIKKLFLKPHEEKRILEGEFWAYDNEIRTRRRNRASTMNLLVVPD